MKLLFIILLFPFFATAQCGLRPPSQFSTSVKDGTLNGQEKARSVKLLATPFTRPDGLIMSTWMNTDKEYKVAQDSGLFVMVNFNDSVSPSYFVSDTNYLKGMFVPIVDFYPTYPNMVVVGDEPGNAVFHVGSLLTYINEVRAITRSCDSLGIKLTADGSVSDIGVEALIYKYYSDNSMSADSANIGRALRNSLKPSILAGTNEEMLQTDTLLTGYATIANLRYVNLHIKIPRVDSDSIFNTVIPSNLFKEFDKYIYMRTKKHAMTNEVAARFNTSSTFVQNILIAGREAHFPFVSTISNNNGDAAERPLIVNFIPQSPNGTGYKEFMNQYYRTTP